MGIGGAEYGTVDDEEVGIGGRQTVTVLIVDGPRHGQFHQSVGLAIERPESCQLRFHQLQILILFVVGVVAANIQQGVIRTDAYQGIDMSVGIIAGQVTVVDPDDPFRMELALEALFDLSLCHRLVAMGGQQTTSRGEHRTFSVALDGAPFEYEVQTVLILAFYFSLLVNPAVDGIVEFGREFLTPTVEAEIK